MAARASVMAPSQMKARAPSRCSSPTLLAGAAGNGGGRGAAGAGVAAAASSGVTSSVGTGSTVTLSTAGGGGIAGSNTGGRAAASGGVGAALAIVVAVPMRWRSSKICRASWSFCSRRPDTFTRATMARIGVPTAQTATSRIGRTQSTSSPLFSP
jgi:hypothetical protein